MAEGPLRLVLRAEGLALFLAGLYAYAVIGGTWWMFALLFFVPDASVLAYVFGPRIGAAAYNALHTTVLPLMLGVAGWAGAAPLLTTVAVIWLCHIGFDRMLGYGLKYAQGFHHTHLGRIGNR